MVLTNGFDRELLVRVERTASRSDALTAARAASSALFRELFPGELLAPGQLATVSMVTFLVTALDPDQADALYLAQGDAGAFGVIHEHFRRLGDAIRDGGGAVIKTQGDGVLASFGEVTAAVRTALELPIRLAVNESNSPFAAADRRASRSQPGRHAQRPARLLRGDRPPGDRDLAICSRRRAGVDPRRGVRSRGCRLPE